MVSRYSPNFDIQLKVPKTDRLVDALGKLPDKVQKKVARTAARKGATVMRKAAIRNARQFDDKTTKEQVWRNVVVQEATRSSKRVGGVFMRVGVRGGAKQYSNTRENVRKQRVGKSYKTNGSSDNPGGDTWYWRFLEFGTAKTQAKSFLRSAMQDNAQKVFDTIAVEMDRGLAKILSEVKVK